MPKPARAVKNRRSVTPPTPPIRMSAEDRRGQLIQVAIDLFSRKGFNGTTTREIALAAGVTEAIIFRHFTTKQQLYKAMIDQHLAAATAEQWKTGLQALIDKNDDEGVFRWLIEGIIFVHREQPEFERVMLYATLEGLDFAQMYMHELTGPIINKIRGYIKRRQSEGAIRPFNIDAVLSAIAGMAKHFAQCKYVEELREPCLPDQEAIDTFAKIAMHGLVCRTPNSLRKSRSRK